MTDVTKGAPAPLEYPHIVVRTHACNYQREPLQLGQGEADFHLGYRSSRLTHPGVDAARRILSEAARTFLCEAVLASVRRIRMRMCIIWGPGDCTFVEEDGIREPSKDLPGFGMRVVDGAAARS